MASRSRRDREAVLTLAGLSLLALAGACGGSEPGAREPAAPSVLLIVVDTLRADHLGAYGHSRPTSPNIDRLAQGGAVFEHAQAPASWTLPSMASLLTGLAPSRHGSGVERNADGLAKRRGFLGLTPEVPTLAEALARRGHATAAVVTNHFLKPEFGLHRGFQHYSVQEVNARGAVDELLGWFEADPGVPFFVLAHFMDVHLPYEAGAEARGMFTRDVASSMQLPVDGIRKLRRAAPALPAEDRAFVAAAYDEEIAFVDAELGRLLGALRAAGRLDRTYVIVTSDHGEELFDHGGFEHGHSMHQELLHVPLIVAGPGIEPRRIPAPVSLLDVAATLCSLTGTEHDFGGRSLAPALRGERETGRSIFSEQTLYGEDQTAALAWPHKLILLPSGPLAFDLEQDPAERTPLPVAGPFAELRAQLERHVREERGRAFSGSHVQLDSETAAELEDLGYAGDD